MCNVSDPARAGLVCTAGGFIDREIVLGLSRFMATHRTLIAGLDRVSVQLPEPCMTTTNLYNKHFIQTRPDN